MSDTLVTTRFDAPLLADLDYVAYFNDTSREDVVAEAVRRFVTAERQTLETFIQEGIDSANRSELTPHEEVFQEIRARRATLHATADE